MQDLGILQRSGGRNFGVAECHNGIFRFAVDCCLWCQNGGFVGEGSENFVFLNWNGIRVCCSGVGAGGCLEGVFSGRFSDGI